MQELAFNSESFAGHASFDNSRIISYFQSKLSTEHFLKGGLGQLAVCSVLGLEANLASIDALLESKLCQKVHASNGSHTEVNYLLTFGIRNRAASNEEFIIDYGP